MHVDGLSNASASQFDRYALGMRKFLARYHPVGLSFALLFFTWSLTPSLLTFVTLRRVAADMALSAGVPAGHGHAYGDEAAGWWAASVDPVGWDDSDTQRVRDAIHNPEVELPP